MGKYFFMRTVLNMISDDAFFKRMVSIVLKVIAALIGLSGLTGFVYSWNIVSNLPASKMLGGIVFQLFFAAAIYMMIHTLLIRAKDVAALPEAEFTAIPVASVLFKVIGEVYAGFSISIAVGGGIFIWFAGINALYVLKRVGLFLPHFGDGSFTGGILYIFGGMLSGFSVLISAYLLSELLIVVFDMRRNTQTTRII